MTLRDRIMDQIDTSMHVALELRDESAESVRAEWLNTRQESADAILAAVRDALTSSPAITAGVRSVQQEKDWPHWDKNDIVAVILIAALDAVTQEEKP